MFTARRGRMFDWLETVRDMTDCGKGSPIEHVHRQGMIGENFMAVHANYLAPGDADLLGRGKASVVHCPRSHAYFGHAPFPYDDLAAAGVNICIGTDSLASMDRASDGTCELNMFAEMQAFAVQRPNLTPRTLVRLVTIHGARALGKAGQLGELSPGACADLISIPFSGPTRGAWKAVVRHSGAVSGVMIDGCWAVQPPPE